VALAKVFQHNHNLQTVYWDGNDTTITGLKAIKLGLIRNDTIKHMPLPLLDIAQILKNPQINTDEVVELSKDIQRMIYEKVAKAEEAAGRESLHNKDMQHILPLVLSYFTK